MSETRILAVDDEYLIRWTLQKNLEKAGYVVFLAETGEEALRIIKEEVPDLALLDITLPGIDGFEVLERALKIDQSLIAIMLTAQEEVDNVVRAMRLGAFDYLAKPFDFKKIQMSIEKALEASQLKREIKHLRQERRERSGFSRIIAASPEMLKIIQITEKIAHSDAATVLIQGESGTGKDMVAQAIHYQSKRESKPFIAINCAGFTEQLLENELCGHEKGAYTDAREVKKGLLEVADGGSLFLDEIGDMSLAMQAKILRLIEHKTFHRMGGIKDIRVDVRIITATNKDLKKLIQEDKFREDLYYRINIIGLRLPSLRERRDDILLLAQHFVKQYNEDFHKSLQMISPEAKKFLFSYNWPGNVRELRNIIERAMILGEGDTLLLEHLPQEIMGQAPAGRETVPGLRISPAGISMERVEEDLVRQALQMTGGNQTKAARLLDLSRDSLRYRMQKFGIETIT